MKQIARALVVSSVLALAAVAFAAGTGGPPLAVAAGTGCPYLRAHAAVLAASGCPYLRALHDRVPQRDDSFPGIRLLTASAAGGAGTADVARD